MTSVIASAVSAPVRPPPEFTFTADHPFVVVITDRRSEAILFMGVVMNTQSDER